MPARVVRCISRGAPLSGGFRGRVTEALKRITFVPDDTAFYVCGSAAMVADARAIVEDRGARDIRVEAY